MLRSVVTSTTSSQEHVKKTHVSVTPLEPRLECRTLAWTKKKNEQTKTNERNPRPSHPESCPARFRSRQSTSKCQGASSVLDARRDPRIVDEREGRIEAHLLSVTVEPGRLMCRLACHAQCQEKCTRHPCVGSTWVRSERSDATSWDQRSDAVRDSSHVEAPWINEERSDATSWDQLSEAVRDSSHVEAP